MTNEGFPPLELEKRHGFASSEVAFSLTLQLLPWGNEGEGVSKVSGLIARSDDTFVIVESAEVIERIILRPAANVLRWIIGGVSEGPQCGLVVFCVKRFAEDAGFLIKDGIELNEHQRVLLS